MDYEAWRALLRDERLPAAYVDVDALNHNIDAVRAGLGDSDVTVRVATKSVRHPWTLEHIRDHGGAAFAGWMTFSAAETLYLYRRGLDDFLVGYPAARADEADALCEVALDGGTVVAMIDSAHHAEILHDAALRAGVELEVCIDLDASLQLAAGRLHLGVRRSPVRGPDDALDVARKLRRFPSLRLTAVMAYEAQIAGLRDHNPGSRHLDPVRRLIRRASKPVVLERRRAVVDALRADGHEIRLVNGGGTGSVQFTAQDDSVTEVTAGSGFFCPHLFDGSGGLDLRPAAFFAIPIARMSDPGYVTCSSGGFIASGPTDADKSPVVHLPVGLSPVDMEGWGEVQTPFDSIGCTAGLRVGDPVICRHAKAGELAERFAHYRLIRKGKLETREPTYRGLGQTFY